MSDDRFETYASLIACLVIVAAFVALQVLYH